MLKSDGEGMSLAYMPRTPLLQLWVSHGIFGSEGQEVEKMEVLACSFYSRYIGVDIDLIWTAITC